MIVFTALFGGCMTVKEILAKVAKLAEGDSLSQAITNGNYNSDDQIKSKTDLLLACYNSIIKDAAINYCDYVKRTIVTQKVFFFATLKEPVLKIILVENMEKKPIPYVIRSDGIEAESTPFVIEYKTVPADQKITENFALEGNTITNAIVYGVLAEYCLVQNRIEEAQNWENRYRQFAEYRRDYKSRRIKAGKLWGL